MRTFTHTSATPVTFRLSLGAGLVEIVAEDRTDATVTLTPTMPGDDVAAGLIERATHASDGDRFSVTVPRPTGQAGTVVQAGGVSVFQNVGIVSGTLTGVTITGNGNIYVGGNVGGLVAGVSVGGGVRATVRVPTASRVEVTTDTATVTTTGPLAALRAETVSGDVLADSADTLDAKTVSGDIRATTRNAHASTTSGDVRVTLYGPRATLRSISGDVTAHAAVDADITATSVSGDIRIVSDPGVRVRTSLRSVSGDVRTA